MTTVNKGLQDNIVKAKCLFCGAEFKEIYDEDILEKIRAFKLAHGINCPKFKFIEKEVMSYE